MAHRRHSSRRVLRLMTACFHCGLAVPRGAHFSVTWDGEARALCCRGCQAVAQAILNAGLDDYYRRRTALAHRANGTAPADMPELAAFDHPQVQRSFVRDAGDRREATLILEGITCAACVWLNEQQLRRLPGVANVRVNYATRRAHVTWDDARLRLSDILRAVQDIGYRAHPYDPARSQQLLMRERRALLRRLGIAAVLGAQIMTLAVALYLGDWSGGDPRMRAFFYWVSLLLAIPILLYSAQPFFRAAWNDLRRGRAGMDVPITLGVITAFGASAWATLSGDGVVYFDSIAMFVFFLLGARYFELSARARSAATAEALAPASPAIANQLDENGTVQTIPVAALQPGNVVLVRPGETVPADGIVAAGQSSANESLLTGESLPVAKEPGTAVIGGSVNVESPLTVRVEKVGADTLLAHVLRLLDRAQAERPHLAQLADQVASWFVVGVLVLAALVGIYWWQHDPARALPVVIAVLVVTCPCALGLATPAAFTAATGALARVGVLTARAHALETLAHADHFVFDKTGTLTLGEPRLKRIEPFAERNAEQCLAAAAALERYSEHPIARAIVAAAPPDTKAAVNASNSPGHGIRGVVDGEMLYVGSPQYVAGRTAFTPEAVRSAELTRNSGSVVVLADRRRLLAAFTFEDRLRPGARELISELHGLGKQITLLSGDRADTANSLARDVGIDRVQAELNPEQKLENVRRLQADGAVVAMVGDGVNDAPVLGAAQLSIAMGSAAAVSAAAADMLLLARDLRPISHAVRTARRASAVIRQNMAWAIGYNLIAVPAAAAGYVAPWLAALGMSLSSALVVANALRLARTNT
jgi:Cu2+-exporting ATPase